MGPLGLRCQVKEIAKVLSASHNVNVLNYMNI